MRFPSLRSSVCPAVLMALVLVLTTACAGRPATPSPTPTPPLPTPTVEPAASVEIALVPLANPVSGFTISYPQGWVYSADLEQSYIAESDEVLRSGNPLDGAMVLIMSRPVRQLEQELGGEATSDSVFSWVGLNLFRNRGALIGATEPRQFGSSEGVAGQVMWVDTEQSARIQAYMAATVVEGMATVVLGMVEEGRWNVTWPLFDAMLDSLVLSTPNVYDDVARGDLAAGGRGSAELTAGWSDHWNYTSPGDEYVAVSVEAVAQRWDPYLEVYDAQGRLMGDDDNGGTGYNARLGAVWLPASGTYTLYVSGYAGAGPYDVQLDPVDPLITPIRYGEVLSGEIAAMQDWQVWTFEGQAGDPVDIALVPLAELDGVVNLHAPDGRILGLSDDPQQTGARITGLLLPEDGLYRVVAHSANDTTGPYQIELARLEASGGGPITYGQPVSGTIMPSQTQAWTFDGAQGDLLTISMGAQAGELDSNLALLAPDGAQLVTDDNSGPVADALIEGFLLSASGTYTVVAGAGEGAAGPYVLSVGATPVRGTLEYGQTVTDTVAAGEHHNWLFEGRAGDGVTITMTASPSAEGVPFDGYLELYALDGQRLAFDDDSAGDGSPRIADFVLPSDGTYRIAAMGYLAQDQGTYTLVLIQAME